MINRYLIHIMIRLMCMESWKPNWFSFMFAFYMRDYTVNEYLNDVSLYHIGRFKHRILYPYNLNPRSQLQRSPIFIKIINFLY